MKRFINYKTGILASAIALGGMKLVESSTQVDVMSYVSSVSKTLQVTAENTISNALAQEEDTKNSEPKAEEKEREPISSGIPDPNKKPEDFINDEVKICKTSEALLQVVEDERLNLELKKQEVQEELIKVDLAKARIQLELDNLKSIRDEVSALLKKSESLFTEDVQRLINLSKAMKPKEAAALMNNMDTELAVMVLGKMP